MTDFTSNRGILSPAGRDEDTARHRAEKNTPSRRLLTVDEAAFYIGRSPYAMRHLISKGLIAVVRIGSRIHIDRADLDELIDNSKVRYDF